MADHPRPSFDHSKRYPRYQGYSRFDPGASAGSGLSNSSEEVYSGRSVDRIGVKESREKVSVSWENIDVFVEVPGPSFLKRLCFGIEEHEKPTSKQVLFDGKNIYFTS